MKIRIHRCIELVHIPHITAQNTPPKFLQTGLLENYRCARRHVLEYSRSLLLLYCICKSCECLTVIFICLLDIMKITKQIRKL